MREVELFVAFSILASTILIMVELRVSAKLSRIECRLNRLFDKLGLKVLEEPSDRVKELAEDPSNKILAIKIYRKETGVGLAEAKKAVEDYINSLQG